MRVGFEGGYFSRATALSMSTTINQIVCSCQATKWKLFSCRLASAYCMLEGYNVLWRFIQVPILIVREIIKREVEVPDLGSRIKQAQVDSGMSVEKVIRSIDISRTYWNKLVSDKDMAISIDLLKRIEEFFSVDFSVKFDEEKR